MIFEAVAGLAYDFFLTMFKVLGVSFDFSFEVPALDTFLEVLSTAFYFFPWRYIWPIPMIIFSLMGFRIGLTFVRFVLSFFRFR